MFYQENCELCANSHGNCEVCLDYKYRTGQTARGNRFHRDETRLNLVGLIKIKNK